MIYRNRALLYLACLSPRCMSCFAPNVGQVVSAHSNSQRDGKAMGLKASDAAIAFMCDACHTDVDAGSGTREERQGCWELAHRRTMRWLIESGHLVVSIEPQAPPPAAKKPKRKMTKGRKLQSRPFAKPDVPVKIPSRPFGRKLK